MTSVLSSFRNILKKKNNFRERWTFLIYADGNNDLAPEIYQSFVRIMKERIQSNVTVVLQLALAPSELVQTLRPQLPSLSYGQFAETARYQIDQRGVQRMETLGNINMADPTTLADFLKWGSVHYPADHRMVILSGHGAGFAGLLTDYTQEIPYIMSIQGLIQSLIQCHEETGMTIDGLLLDTCYMNMIELWYEFSLPLGTSIKHLLVPLQHIGLEGLPWHLLLRYFQESIGHGLPLPNTLRDVTERINSGSTLWNKVVSLHLDPSPFITLKDNLHLLGEFLLDQELSLRDIFPRKYGYSSAYPLVSLLDCCDLLQEQCQGGCSICFSLRESLSKIMVSPDLENFPKKQNAGPTLYLPADLQQYMTSHSHYEGLLFVKNHPWLEIVKGSRSLENPIHPMALSSSDSLPPPMSMPLGSVAAVILQQNPGFQPEDAWKVVKKIGWR